MDRDDTRDSIDGTQRAIAAAANVGEMGEKRRLRWQFLAHHSLDVRVAGKHRAVAPKHPYRPALLQSDCPIELLKIANVDVGEHDAEEFTKWPVDAAREKE